VSLYADLAADVLDLLEGEIGQDLLLETPDATFSTSTGAVSGSNTTYAVRGVVDGRVQSQGRYGQNSVSATGRTDGSTVRKLTAHIAAQDLGATPLVGWICYLAATADATKRYIVARVDEVSPAGTPVLYSLELAR
jgi:hypothetical protein